MFQKDIQCWALKTWLRDSQKKLVEFVLWHIVLFTTQLSLHTFSSYCPCYHFFYFQNPQTGSQNLRAALPLSIFGDEMPDTDEQTVSQDLSPFATTSAIKNGCNSPGFNLSINDIWNLYSQAENKNSPNVTPKANENGFHASPGVSGANSVTGDGDDDDGFGDFMDASPETRFAHESAQKSYFNHAPHDNENGLQASPTVLNSDLINGADDFEDDSWEFKDAISETRSQADLPTQLSTKLEQLDYVDFYSKLKDELCNAVLFHLQNLKVGNLLWSSFDRKW